MTRAPRDIDYEIGNMIYRARREGLNESQAAIWHAIEGWLNEHAKAPTLHEIAMSVGCSRQLVWQYLHVLEAMGLIQIIRRRNGRQQNRGILLVIAPSDLVEDDEPGGAA